MLALTVVLGMVNRSVNEIAEKLSSQLSAFFNFAHVLQIIEMLSAVPLDVPRICFGKPPAFLMTATVFKAIAKNVRAAHSETERSKLFDPA